MNDDLCIALPTYNRAPFLDTALSRLIPLVAPYGIAIFVSDNCSTDDTIDVVKRHSATYPLVRYHCNDRNLGLDGNFEKAIRLGMARYTWLLGDTYVIEKEALDAVLDAVACRQAYASIIVDVERRAAAIAGRTYTDHVALFTDLGWHMTCMSVMILSRDLIRDAAFVRYRNTLFIHLGIVLDYLAGRSAPVLWLSGIGAGRLHVAGETKVSWESRWFDVWVDHWTAFVLSLPAVYPLRAKLACVRRHGEKSGVFSLGNLVRLRAAGTLDIRALTGRWAALRLAAGRRRFLMLACAIVPMPIARMAVRARGRRS